jgi:hypothetical protein
LDPNTRTTDATAVRCLSETRANLQYQFAVGPVSLLSTESMHFPASTQVRRVASTEARRLGRIPPQNAEHGVVRNYVRTSRFFPLYCLCSNGLDPTQLGYSTLFFFEFAFRAHVTTDGGLGVSRVEANIN